MSDPRVVILHHSSGDWQAVYVDGKKIFEHHSIQISELLEHLDISLHEIYDADSLAIDGEDGNYPATLPDDLTVYTYRLSKLGDSDGRMRAVSKDEYDAVWLTVGAKNSKREGDYDAWWVKGIITGSRSENR